MSSMNGNSRADERKNHRIAAILTVAFVIGMNGNGGVTQHRLRPCRRNLDESLSRPGFSFSGYLM